MPAKKKPVIKSKIAKPKKLTAKVAGSQSGFPVVGIAASAGGLEALHESEERYRLFQGILQSTSDGILAVNRENEVLFANEGFVEMWMIPPEMMASKDDALLLQYVLDQLSDPQSFLQKVQELYNSAEESFDTLYFKDGRVFERLSRPMLLGTEVRGRVWSFRDIIERMRAEKALRESEERHRSLFDRMMDGAYRSTHEGKFLDVNPAMVKMFGYSSKEEMLEVDIKSELYFAPEERGSHVLDTGREEMDVYRMRRKDGSEIWVEDHGFYVHDKQGRIMYHEGMLRDITGRKQAEAELFKLRKAVEASSEVIFLTDRDGLITFVNPEFARLYGYSAEEVVGRATPRILKSGRMKPEDYALFWKTILGKQILRSEIVNQTKDGRLLTIEGSINPVLDDDGNITGFLAIQRDITDRKQAEEALRRHDAYLAALHETSLGLINRLNLTDLLTSIVTRATLLVNTMHGYLYLVNPEGTHLEVRVGTGIFTDYIGFQLKPGEGLAGQVWQTGQPMRVDDYARWQHRAASLEHANFRAIAAAPLKSDARVIGVIGVGQIDSDARFSDTDFEILLRFAEMASLALDNANLYQALQQDITERQQAEEALRQAEAKYRNIFENAIEGVFQTVPSGKFITANPALARMLGYNSPEELIADVDNINHEFYKQPARRVEFMRQVEGHGMVSNFESQVYRKDGRAIWISENARVVRDDAGQVLHYEGTLIDITKRKQAEEALRESEERFKGAFEHSPIGIALVSLEGKWLQVNSRVCSIIGYSKDELLTKTFQDITHPDDLDIDLDYVRQMLAGEIETYTMEKRYFHKEGGIVWVLLAVALLKDDSGFPLYFISQIEDITKRKYAEEELRRAKDALETVNLELQQSLEREKILACTDGLTRLSNRRYFFELAVSEFHASIRYEHPLTFLMFDMDGFKQVNDILGHAIGDRLLMLVAQVTLVQVRASDVVARYGGDEFIVMLPHTDAQHAFSVAERIRANVAGIRMETGKEPLSITLSMGIAEMRYGLAGENVEHVIRRADEAMYAAKAKGRNRIAIFGEDDTNAASL